MRRIFSSETGLTCRSGRQLLTWLQGALPACRHCEALAASPFTSLHFMTPPLRCSLSWAASLKPSAQPPSTAEEAFLASERRRQESLNARSHELLWQTTAGDDRRLVREEAERQAKRQIDAT